MRPQVWIAIAFLLAPSALIVATRADRLPDLTGQVVDERGPAAGARVRYQGRLPSTVTDSQGRFRLSASGASSARVTACKAGYLIAGADAKLAPLLLRLERLPAKDDAAYEWVDPRPDPASRLNCGNCHEQIYREWSAEGHAHSTSNRHFLNLYDGSDWKGHANRGWNLLSERPDGAGVCNACHAPTASFAADLRCLIGVAGQGIHCDYCHKVAAADTERVGLTHGRYALSLLRPEHGQLFFGPLDDIDRHEDAYSPLYRESRYCAACHEGTVFGVHVYGTYGEWLASPARRQGKECQSCHMAPAGMTNIAPGKGGIERPPATLASHRFFQGSQIEMLRQALCLHADVRREANATRVEIDLSTLAIGHRLPTGFVDRNLVLVVKGLDKEGKDVVAVSGPRLPKVAGPGMAGEVGKLYAKVLRDHAGRSPVPFWRADAEADDRRLLPGCTDHLSATFLAQATHIHVRLLYRRFWPEVAATKGWPDNELQLVDRIYPIAP